MWTSQLCASMYKVYKEIFSQLYAVNITALVIEGSTKV